MKAIIADLEECVWFSPNNVEASATKGFEAETHFEPSTLGGVVGACNMEESMQSDNMEKESGQKECSLVQGEFTRMFDNSDVHDDNGGTGKEECQPYTLSRKRKRSDMNSNESQPVDNASGQNSNEKPDEFVPTKSQPGEMKLHTSNTHQSFASGKVQVLAKQCNAYSRVYLYIFLFIYIGNSACLKFLLYLILKPESIMRRSLCYKIYYKERKANSNL